MEISVAKIILFTSDSRSSRKRHEVKWVLELSTIYSVTEVPSTSENWSQLEMAMATLRRWWLLLQANQKHLKPFSLIMLLPSLTCEMATTSTFSCFSFQTVVAVNYPDIKSGYSMDIPYVDSLSEVIPWAVTEGKYQICHSSLALVQIKVNNWLKDLVFACRVPEGLLQAGLVHNRLQEGLVSPAPYPVPDGRLTF